MVDAVERMAFTEDKRSGEYLMLEDTKASLRRLLTGVAVAAMAGLLLGINMGLFPGISAGLAPFITFISMVPPLAILPVLFIALGVDELAKVSLIFLGTFPMITRDIYLATRKLPGEQITKALTLGASQLDIVYRIVLPQILPRLIDTVRLSLGAAWLFLIAAEAIASTDGLGLPHLPGPPLPGHGRDPALRALDHRPGLRHGLAAAGPAALAVLLVPGDQGLNRMITKPPFCMCWTSTSPTGTS